MKIQKVWHVSSNRWNSAITEYALSCALATRQMGHQVIFSPLAASPAERRSRSLGLETSSIEHFGLRGVLNFKRMFNELKPDTLFVYGGPETSLASLSLSPSSCRILRFRGQDIENSWSTRFQSCLALRSVKYQIAPSLLLKTKLSLATRKPAFKVQLGLDVSRFDPNFEELEAIKGKSSRPELLVFGRFDPVKGHAHIMKIMRCLLQDWPQHLPRPRLLIAGREEGLSLADLERTAVNYELKLEEDVRFIVGDIPSVATLLARATIGVVPSLGSEVICRVAQEFLLCGTPVCVSGAGSLEEVLLFDGAGFSYRGMNDEAIAKTLQAELIKYMNEGLSEKIKRRDHAIKYFSLEAMQQQLVSLLGV